MELLHGAVSEKDHREIHKSLGAFAEANLGDGDWKILGDRLYKYRVNGLTLPHADVIIASTGMKYDYAVWTENGHFILIQKVFLQLKVLRTEELMK